MARKCNHERSQIYDPRLQERHSSYKRCNLSSRRRVQVVKQALSFMSPGALQAALGAMCTKLTEPLIDLEGGVRRESPGFTMVDPVETLESLPSPDSA